MDDGVWRTINGVHVLIGKDGSILKGPKSLQKSDIQKRLRKQISKKKNEQELEKEDWKVITKGDYDAKTYMGETLTIENLKIKQEYQGKVGLPTPIPKNNSDYEKGIKWYKNSIEASQDAKKEYTYEKKKFQSKKYQKLIQDKIDFFEENIKNAEKDLEWYKNAFKQYSK